MSAGIKPERRDEIESSSIFRLFLLVDRVVARIVVSTIFTDRLKVVAADPGSSSSMGEVGTLLGV